MTPLEADGEFSASLSDVYDELLVPLIFESYAEALTLRLRDLSSVDAAAILEIAAGTGVLTRAMSRALPPSALITASDLVPAMIDRAMRIGTERPVRWEQADVMSLPFGQASFDAVVCQFGVMFFAPQPHAFAEVHRVMRLGAVFLFSVWDRIDVNEFAAVVTRSLEPMFPDDPPRFLERIPHGYHDPERVAADLASGGFEAQPSVERIEFRSRAATAHDVAAAYCAGTPLRHEIELRRPGSLAVAVDVAARALDRQFGSSDLDGRISAHLFSVTK